MFNCLIVKYYVPEGTKGRAIAGELENTGGAGLQPQNPLSLRLEFGQEGQWIMYSYNCPILASESQPAGDKRWLSETRFLPM